MHHRFVVGLVSLALVAGCVETPKVPGLELDTGSAPTPAPAPAPKPKLGPLEVVGTMPPDGDPIDIGTDVIIVFDRVLSASIPPTVELVWGGRTYPQPRTAVEWEFLPAFPIKVLVEGTEIETTHWPVGADLTLRVVEATAEDGSKLPEPFEFSFRVEDGTWRADNTLLANEFSAAFARVPSANRRGDIVVPMELADGDEHSIQVVTWGATFRAWSDPVEVGRVA